MGRTARWSRSLVYSAPTACIHLHLVLLFSFLIHSATPVFSSPPPVSVLLPASFYSCLNFVSSVFTLLRLFSPFIKLLFSPLYSPYLSFILLTFVSLPLNTNTNIFYLYIFIYPYILPPSLYPLSFCLPSSPWVIRR